MNELIKLFNTNKTHIEIDTINQKENGLTNDPSIFTYTIQLIDNNDNDPIASISIDQFSDKEIKDVIKYFAAL